MNDLLKAVADAVNRVTEKATSGRWILSVLCGFSFCFATVRGMLSATEVLSVVMLVFGFYFGQRSTEKPL